MSKMDKLKNERDKKENDIRERMFQQAAGLSAKEEAASSEEEPMLNNSEERIEEACSKLVRKTYYLTQLHFYMIEAKAYKDREDKSETVRKIFDAYPGFTDEIKQEALERMRMDLLDGKLK